MPSTTTTVLDGSVEDATLEEEKDRRAVMAPGGVRAWAGARDVKAVAAGRVAARRAAERRDIMIWDSCGNEWKCVDR